MGCRWGWVKTRNDKHKLAMPAHPELFRAKTKTVLGTPFNFHFWGERRTLDLFLVFATLLMNRARKKTNMLPLHPRETGAGKNR